MDFRDSEFWIVSLALGALAGALIAIINLIKIFKGWGDRLKQYWTSRKMRNEKLNYIVTKFDVIESKIDALVSELSPNSGKSLRDLIEKINENTGYNREYQRAILDDDAKMVFETDSHGHIRWANNTFLMNIKKTLDQLKDYGWLNLITVEYRDDVREEWDSCMEDKREFNYIFEISCPGGPIKVNMIAVPIKVGGYVKGYHGTIKVL